VRYIIGDVKLAILLEQNTQVAAAAAHDVIGTAFAAVSTSALGEPSLGFTTRQAMYNYIQLLCVRVTTVAVERQQYTDYYRNNMGFGTDLLNTCVL
jgi:hypothetical protein